MLSNLSGVEAMAGLKLPQGQLKQASTVVLGCKHIFTARISEVSWFRKNFFEHMHVFNTAYAAKLLNRAVELVKQAVDIIKHSC